MSYINCMFGLQREVNSLAVEQLILYLLVNVGNTKP